MWRNPQKRKADKFRCTEQEGSKAWLRPCREMRAGSWVTVLCASEWLRKLERGPGAIVRVMIVRSNWAIQFLPALLQHLEMPPAWAKQVAIARAECGADCGASRRRAQGSSKQ